MKFTLALILLPITLLLIGASKQHHQPRARRNRYNVSRARRNLRHP